MKILLIFSSIFLINQFVFSQNILEDKYDIKQYILALQISNTSTLISGNVIINANVTATSLDTFVVDLIDTIIPNQTYMIVDSVFVNGVINLFQHHDELLFIPLMLAIPQGQLFSVQIYYHGNGAASIQTNSCGISKHTYTGITHTYTFSQTNWSKVWWPCKQDLKDKADSVTFYITTDSTNKSGSNGILKSTETLSNGKIKYKWETHYPIDYYLISFSVGSFIENITYAPLPNTQDSVLLQSLLFANSSYYQTHLKAIDKTKQLLYLYSDLLGTYPFKDEKYGYSVVGGLYRAMENQTMSSFNYQALDTTSVFYSQFFWFLTAHELAHQWFGDYVTCGSWNYIWLNEGFASYMEYIALQNIESQTNADYWINNAHTKVKSFSGGSVFIPDSLVTNENNIFDYRLQYKKGSSILHIMRYEINNDSLFFAVLKNYLSTFAFSTATADDFKQVAETTTGIDFTDYFNQWFYGEGYPIFNINWNQNNDTLTITSNQTTSTSITTLFKTHFDLKVNFVVGDTTLRLFQGVNNEIYKLYFPQTVSSIEFDPNFWLIQTNSIITGIEKNIKSFSFNILPNPAENIINVITINEIDFQNTILGIYDIHGQLLIEQRVLQNNFRIDISKLEKGIYVVKLTNSKSFAVSKFVKMQHFNAHNNSN